MISEGLSDAEDWSNGWWKYSSAITIISHFKIYSNKKKKVLKKEYIYISIHTFQNITLFTVFFIKNSALVCTKDMWQKHYKIVLIQKFSILVYIDSCIETVCLLISSILVHKVTGFTCSWSWQGLNIVFVLSTLDSSCMRVLFCSLKSSSWLCNLPWSIVFSLSKASTSWKWENNTAWLPDRDFSHTTQDIITLIAINIRKKQTLI